MILYVVAVLYASLSGSYRNTPNSVLEYSQLWSWTNAMLIENVNLPLLSLFATLLRLTTMLPFGFAARLLNDFSLTDNSFCTFEGVFERAFKRFPIKHVCRHDQRLLAKNVFATLEEREGSSKQPAQYIAYAMTSEWERREYRRLYSTV